MPERMYGLGDKRLECSPPGRDPGVLADGKFNISQQYAWWPKGPTLSWDALSIV